MQCSTKTCAQQCTTVHNSAQLRCFENGNDDFGVEAFWIGDAARVGYFVPLNGPLNGHPPSIDTMLSTFYDMFWSICEKCVPTVTSSRRRKTYNYPQQLLSNLAVNANGYQNVKQLSPVVCFNGEQHSVNIC